MKKILVIICLMAVGLSAGPVWADMSNFVTFTAEGAAISIDAKGLDTATDGTIRAEIPVGAQVTQAFLYSASIWNLSTLSNVVFDGNTLVSNAASRLDVGPKDSNPASENRWDVTSIVQAKVGGGSGTFNFGLRETGDLDGEILAVLYKVPTKPISTAFLFDGELATTGSTFNIALAKPIDKTDPNFQAILSLGISFGFQNNGNPATQFSQVDVNGKRLTTSAGGEDDGFGSNGGLITAGGIGDSITNPANPLSQPIPVGSTPSFRYDDELYSLKDFVNNGDKLIQFSTLNPSNDDNVFFSAFTTLGEATAPPTVPEPGTLLLLGTGLLGLVIYRRRK